MLLRPTWKLLWPASFVLLSSLVAYGYSFAGSNMFNQIPVMEALIDKSLFSRDFYIQEMAGFTPRFYYYHLILLFHSLGLSLSAAAFGLFVLAFSSMILGLWAIGGYLERFAMGEAERSRSISSQASSFTGLALAFLGLSALAGTLGVTDIFRVEPIAAIYAMGIAIWGIYFCCRRQWQLGYLMFGLACLLQFLIGFLPACLWGISLLLETVFRRRPGQFFGTLAIFSLFVALVYVPMVAAGNTSSAALSDATFVHLYGYVRHPHHLIESSFPAKKWRDFVCLVGVGLISLRLSDRLSSALKRDLALTLGVTCGLLLLGYVFVELIPVALVAKLQFARATPFAMITVWTAVSVVAGEYHQRGNYPVSLLLLALPLVDRVGPIALLVLTLSLLLAKSGAKSGAKSVKGQPFWAPLMRLETIRLTARRDIAIAYTLFLTVLLACGSYLPVFFASLAYPHLRQSPRFFQRSRPYFQAATVGLVFYLALLITGTISSTALTPLHRNIRVHPQPEDALAQIAVQFGQTSPADALVLVPPSDEVFRFYSHRSVVVTFKSFPFTDRGILTWQARLESILGPPNAQMMSADYAYELYRQRSSQTLSALAQSYDASYILTQRGWHPDLTGTVVNRVGNWEIWQLPTAPKQSASREILQAHDSLGIPGSFQRLSEGV